MKKFPRIMGSIHSAMGAGWIEGAARERESREVAAQLQHLREDEKGEKSYLDDLSAVDYLRVAGGLRSFLENIRRTAAHNVVDVGTGTGTALSELATSSFGEGLAFFGTTLTRPPRLDLPGVELHMTSAERLNWVPETVGGVLGLRSIAFSAAPKLVIESIDQHLAPKGALKATFRGKASFGEVWDRRYDELGYQPHDSFSAALGSLGYDIAVTEGGAHDILVAVKPGRKAPSAADLLLEDLETLPEQLQSLAT